MKILVRFLLLQMIGPRSRRSKHDSIGFKRRTSKFDLAFFWIAIHHGDVVTSLSYWIVLLSRMEGLS